MCSERISITRPSGDTFSSSGLGSAVEQRLLVSNTAFQRLDAVSSGLNTRKFRASAFSLITSRRNSPCRRVASASVAPGRFTSTAYSRKSGRRRSRSSDPAVGARVRPHAALPLGGEGAELGSKPSGPVEELLRLVALHPLLEQLHVGGVALHLAEGHLVRAPGPFRGLAVHDLRPRPSLGRAQNHHRPARPLPEPVGAGLLLNGLDVRHRRVECGRHELVHLRGIASLDEVRLVPVAVEERPQLLAAGCARAPWARRSCTRSGGGWAAPPRRGPGSGTCSNASSSREGRSRPRRRPPRTPR